MLDLLTRCTQHNFFWDIAKKGDVSSPLTNNLRIKTFLIFSFRNSFHQTLMQLVGKVARDQFCQRRFRDDRTDLSNFLPINGIMQCEECKIHIAMSVSRPRVLQDLRSRENSPPAWFAPGTGRRRQMVELRLIRGNARAEPRLHDCIPCEKSWPCWLWIACSKYIYRLHL